MQVVNPQNRCVQTVLMLRFCALALLRSCPTPAFHQAAAAPKAILLAIYYCV